MLFIISFVGGVSRPFTSIKGGKWYICTGTRINRCVQEISPKGMCISAFLPKSPLLCMLNKRMVILNRNCWRPYVYVYRFEYLSIKCSGWIFMNELLWIMKINYFDMLCFDKNYTVRISCKLSFCQTSDFRYYILCWFTANEEHWDFSNTFASEYVK